MRRLLLLALLASQLGAAESRIVVAGRNVALWKPEGAAPAAGYPLVVFSHGFAGCSTQSAFLMEALARAGYFVLAPDHGDARCGGGRGMPKPEERFTKDDAWSELTYRDRAADIRALLDAALAGKPLQGVAVDGTRVALAGHSLGGYTVLGLAGGWPSWRDSRVKAVLALSPFCQPLVRKGDLAHLKVPLMYQGGTLDLGITPAIRRLDGAYDHSSAPKYYVEFNGAGHFAWTDLNRGFHPIVIQYSVAFLDAYLRGNRAALESLTAKPPKLVSFLRSDLR